MYAPGSVNGLSVEVLVDTGSAVTLVHKRLVDCIGLEAGLEGGAERGRRTPSSTPRVGLKNPVQMPHPGAQSFQHRKHMLYTDQRLPLVYQQTKY